MSDEKPVWTVLDPASAEAGDDFVGARVDDGFVRLMGIRGDTQQPAFELRLSPSEWEKLLSLVVRST